MSSWFVAPEVLFNPLVSVVYEGFAWPFTSMVGSKIVSRLKDFHGTILEVGSGTGLVTQQLVKLGVPITVVEPSPYMLAVLKGKNLPNVTTYLDRSEKLPVTEQFDALVMTFVLRHVRPELLPLVTEEMARVVKPGGQVFLADLYLPLMGTFPQAIGRDNPNYQVLGLLAVYDPNSLALYLSERGFKLRSIDYGPLFFVIELERQ